MFVRRQLSGLRHGANTRGGLVLPSRGFGVYARLEHVLFELVAGLHSELAERLA